MIPTSLASKLPKVVLIEMGLALGTLIPSFAMPLGSPTGGTAVRGCHVAQAPVETEMVPQVPTNDNDDLDVELDRYFTCEYVAEHCVQVVSLYIDLSNVHVVEPSAGVGVFCKILPAGTIAVDIAPRYAGTIQVDFLSFDIVGFQPILTIGNPPFGKGSSLAIKFFNHAARQSTFIAMIFPRTFRKAFVLRRLNREFHLIHDEDMPPYAFLFRGKPYDVPTMFQIWERRPVERDLPPAEIRHPDFVFTSWDKADFAIQRIGSSAGRVHDDLGCSAISTYFIRATDRSQVARLRAIMDQLDFATPASNTAGYPSLAKSEIIALYREWTEGLPPYWRVTPEPPAATAARRSSARVPGLRTRRSS